MVEKWFGKNCSYQVCQFETDCCGREGTSYPVLIYCSNKENKEDYEGNCNSRLCPLRNN